MFVYYILQVKLGIIKCKVLSNKISKEAVMKALQLSYLVELVVNTKKEVSFF